MFRRLSVLGTLLLAACTTQGPNLSKSALSSCVSNAPTKAEAMAWRSAQRVNSRKAYRSFINNYPDSCYAPVATAKLGTVVEKKAPVVRNVPKAAAPKKMKGGY